MYEIIQLLLAERVTALGLAIAIGGIGIGFGSAINSVGEAIKSRFGKNIELKDEENRAKIEREKDEQEHRQKLEREEAKAKRELEGAKKLEEVLGVVIADRSVADTVREQIDALYPPKTRVEPSEEFEEEPERRKVKRRR